MKQPAELSIERAAGVRCRHIVFYTRNGKKYLDGLYSPTAEQARSDFLAGAAELGWKNVVVEAVEVRASASGEV